MNRVKEGWQKLSSNVEMTRSWRLCVILGEEVVSSLSSIWCYDDSSNIHWFFLKADADLWFKKKPNTFRKTFFMYNSAPSHQWSKLLNIWIKWLSKTLVWWSDRLVCSLLTQWCCLYNFVIFTFSVFYSGHFSL